MEVVSNLKRIKAYNKEIFLCIDENVYALELLPKHELSSKNFDLAVSNVQPRKRYIPPMSHPWKHDSFERYLKKQAHRSNNVA